MHKSVKYLVAMFFCAALLPHCARIASITGGPRDTIGPVPVKITPGQNTLNFDHKSIYVEFDEYVQLKDLQREFYTSPHMKKTPLVTIRGRGFRVDIKDTLMAGQTYSLNWGGAVVDNNEGNPLNGFRYVFSTGTEIDSLVMSGYAEDAQRGDSVSKTFVYFFDAALDSIPEYDSVVFKNSPEAVGRAENNGIFVARNLKPKAYRVYAVQDNNHNRMYDAGTDRIGFVDGTYNPAEMESFDVWYDTIRRYDVAQPQLFFRMFLDERPARQTLIAPTRPQQHKIMLQFGAPWPQIERLTFDSIPPERIITEYLKPTRDSIALWIDIAVPPDTLKGEIVYMRADSTGKLEPFIQPLKLGWKKSESREEQRARERREQAIAEGKEPEPLPNPFKITLNGGDINPEKGVAMEFEMPLSSVDQTALKLTTGDSTNIQEFPVSMVRDSVDVRKWRLEAPWLPAMRYRLLILPGALRDVAGNQNDSITRTFQVPEIDRVGTINIEVVGKTPESEYVVQLTDEGGIRVIDEKRHVKTGTISFGYLSPGKVRVKVIEDVSGNGEWNTGNLVNRSQPERVELWALKEEEPTITVRAGWIEDVKIDMAELFAPITTQSLWQRLEREDAARLEKLMEEVTRRREERARQERQGQRQSAGSMMQGATGLSLPGL